MIKKYGRQIFFIMIFLAALAVRLCLITRDLKYDEIWSLEHYSGLTAAEIFSDLATPNNHPINSLLLQWLWFGRENAWTIRLGSLLFSLSSVWLLYRLGGLLYRKCGAWYAALAGALLPPLIVAGATARGYAGQFFFLLLFSYALIKCRKGSHFYTFLAAASGIFAIISLPSSILYIVPPALFFIIHQFRKRQFYPVHLWIFSLTAVIAALWYLTNWEAFTHTQQFQVPINDFQEFYQWLTEALSLNGIWLFVLLLYFRKREKISLLLLGIITFPLAAAVFTSAAPARVYLPGTAAGILLMISFAYDLKRYRFHFLGLLLAVQIVVSLPILPDTRIIDQMASCRDIDGTITVYGANESYPVSWNHPELIEVYFKQLTRAAAMDQCTLLMADRNLSGIDSAGNTVIWQIPEKYITYSDENKPVAVRLQRTAKVPANTIAFAVYPPMAKELHINNIRFLDTRQRLRLNLWLTRPYTAADGMICHYALIAFKPDKERFFPPQAPIFTFAIEK